MKKLQCEQCGGVLDDGLSEKLRCRYCDTLYRIATESTSDNASGNSGIKKYYYLPLRYLTANCLKRLNRNDNPQFCFARSGFANWWDNELGYYYYTRPATFACNTNKVFIEADEVIIKDYHPTFADFIRPRTSVDKKVAAFIEKCHEWHEKRNQKMAALIEKGKDDTNSYRKYTAWHHPPYLSLDEKRIRTSCSSVPPEYLDGLIVEEIDRWQPRVYQDVFWGYTIIVNSDSVSSFNKQADFSVIYRYDYDHIDGDHYSPLKEVTPNLLVDHFLKRDYSATKYALDNYLRHCESEVVRFHTENTERAQAIQRSINTIWTNSNK